MHLTRSTTWSVLASSSKARASLIVLICAMSQKSQALKAGFHPYWSSLCLTTGLEIVQSVILFFLCPVSLVSPEILTSKSLNRSLPIPHIVYLVHQKNIPSSNTLPLYIFSDENTKYLEGEIGHACNRERMRRSIK